MPRWTGRVTIPIEFVVDLDLDLPAEEDDAAEAAALGRVQEYLQTLTGDHRGVFVAVDGVLDGRGFDEFGVGGDYA